MTEINYPRANRPKTVDDLFTHERSPHAIVTPQGIDRLVDYEELEVMWIRFRNACSKAGLNVGSYSISLDLTPAELEQKLVESQQKYDRGAAIYFGPLADLPEKKYSVEGQALDHFCKHEKLDWPEPENLGEWRQLNQLALATGPTEPEEIGVLRAVGS